MKNAILTGTGIVGGLIASAFGGWSASLTTLLIFMGIDYLTGWTVATVFHKSPKTETGGYESRTGFKGLIRKGMILLFVLIGNRLDIAMGTAYIRDAVCIAFMANELMSIVENAGLMGLPIPKVVTDGLEMLKQNEETKE